MKKPLLTLLLFVSTFIYGYSQGAFNNFENSDDIDVKVEPNADTLWQIGPPAKAFFNEAYSLPNAIMTDSINPYPINQSTWFEVSVGQSILWSYPYIQLEWNYKIDAEHGVDGGIIEASYDEGVTWLNVFSDTIFAPAIVGAYDIDTLFNGEIGVTGVSDWAWMAICWGTFTGSCPPPPDDLFVRFRFVSDSIETNQEGWMIDDFFMEVEIVGSTRDQNILPVLAYPNPTKDELHLDLSGIERMRGSIEMFNTNGQLVKLESIDTVNDRATISTEAIPTGTYWIRIKTEEAVYQTSFVKIGR